MQPNEKAMNALLSGLCEYEFIKVMHCQIAKVICVKVEIFMKEIER